MKKKNRRVRIGIIISAWVFVLCCFFADACYGQFIASSELIANARDYDGKEVVYEGEVIGDAMARGGYAWVNVNDGQNAIGIWIEKKYLKEIGEGGSYKNKGDWVRIAGVFNRACPEHGGVLDIHAKFLKKVKTGSRTPERIDVKKQSFAFEALFLLSFVWILTKIKFPRLPK